MKNVSQTKEHLATGLWGGQHIRADIKEDGAELEFDCATGSIDQAIVLNSENGFDAPGKFIRESPGPARQGVDNSRTVRYVGKVKDQELTLTVSDANSKEEIGTFTLTHGSEGRIRKCM